MCCAPFPPGTPNQYRRCPATCAVEWKKGWPKRYGYKSQRAYMVRTDYKHQETNAARAGRAWLPRVMKGRAKRKARLASRLASWRILNAAIEARVASVKPPPVEYDKAARYMRTVRFGRITPIVIEYFGRPLRISASRSEVRP